MKIIAEYPAFVYDGKPTSIGDLVKWINSPWPLNMDVREFKVIDEWVVSFEYPNNDERVVVEPGSVIYKGSFGAYYTVYERDLGTKFKSLRLDRS